MICQRKKLSGYPAMAHISPTAKKPLLAIFWHGVFGPTLAWLWGKYLRNPELNQTWAKDYGPNVALILFTTLAHTSPIVKSQRGKFSLVASVLTVVFLFISK